MRRHSKLATIALVVILAACGGGSILKSFRVALASSGPLVNSLVASGAIPQSKASAIIADFDAGAQCGLVLQNEFAAISKELPEREQAAQKLNASVGGLKCFRNVVANKNFASHPRIQQVASIAEGVLASLVVFYSDSGPMRASAEKSATVDARNEKDLEQRLKQQVKALEEAMKP